jgi:hypothetical protein
MHRSPPAIAALSAALATVFWPAPASAAPPAGKAARTAHVSKPHGCVKPPVEVTAGGDTATLSLADCSGSATPAGIDQLSVLARPGNAPKPRGKVGAPTRPAGLDVAPGIRRVDPRLVERLEALVEHFYKDGRGARVALVSGYRPKSAGSYHATGRALDLRLEGVKNEDVVAFCKTLADTGCGYYPNSLFVHMDVRDRGAGHVSWIDASRPGEPARYVTSWPPQGDADAVPPQKLPVLPEDDHTDTLAPEPARPGGPLFF